MTEWIKCSDRMPDYGSVVLGTDGERYGIFHRWKDERGSFFECYEEERFEAIWWMPLPKLPEHPNEWISFDEQKPKQNQRIKVKSDNYWNGEGLWQDDKFVYSWVKGACFGSPTHWMPLPERPSE